MENNVSTKSKMRASEQRKKEKRQRKAAMQAKYETWKQAGINSKSRRSLKKKTASNKKHTHPDGFCGNPGCKHCFPQTSVVVYVNTRPASYFRRHQLV